MKTSSPLLRPAASAPRTPASRLRDLNDAPIREDGRFVVYWMTAFRRLSHNFALQRAVEWAEELGQGLVLLEPLRAAYPWASERFHAFVIEGMQEHARELAEGGEGRSALRYYPYLEPKAGEGQGLLRALSQHASVVIADDWPCFHQPSMLAAAAKQLSCRLEAVDASCITPLAELEKTYQRAFSLRKLLHRQAPDWLQASPTEDPLAGLEGLPQPRLPREITQRWPAARLGRALSAILEEIDLPEGPGRVESLRGGSEPARERLEAWVRSGLRLYGAGRNHPDEDAASGLSPWLHFGMISPHEVLERVAVFARRSGLEEVVAGAEGFADELITWRELGHQYCLREPDYASFTSLPEWTQRTLALHGEDPRPQLYTLEELANARTDDEIWNAAQRQLARTGIMHNYLRMLWGKKVIAWSSSPEQAWERLIELNNRYALDGRDPNSYAGISWVFGRFDRAWGPERPIYGTVRYMTSDSTRRKLRLREYLRRYGDTPSLF